MGCCWDRCVPALSVIAFLIDPVEQSVNKTSRLFRHPPVRVIICVSVRARDKFPTICYYNSHLCIRAKFFHHWQILLGPTEVGKGTDRHIP